MPFTLITGTYHLVNRTGAGSEGGFEPDGDSLQFRPANPALLGRLDQPGKPFRLTEMGSTQLRLEGMDALEIHYRIRGTTSNTHQPRPRADEGRDFLTGELGLNPVPYASGGVRVRPPVERDAVPGYILARQLEANGRPVAFAFTGAPAARDGSQVMLRATLLRRSLNYRSLLAGHAYPLFYDTLFADLRAILADAVTQARSAKRGLWADEVRGGVAVRDQRDLEARGVLFPKLFRRLTDFLAEGRRELDRFPAWLARTEEQVLDLSTCHFTHFDDVLAVRGGRIRLTLPPERVVFVSAKTASRAEAPWLRV
jgi:endonuclease YncB( thermonuclease family)